MKKFDTDEETDDLLNDTSEETENEETDNNEIEDWVGSSHQRTS